MIPPGRLSSALAFTVVLLFATLEHAPGQDCCDPEGPFRPGEGYADKPATCKTIAGWLERAPQVDARITLSVRGALSAVEFDGALAYLVICAEPDVRVMCVTYSTNGMRPGDVVLFAGGYSRVGTKQVMLDPCLASKK
ncbi:hypothetical protein [Candidatus Phyllobacterium onerii]|uniref:hypothetical protein n=1 Tax=Candidatus Phyllobacterium onerii TaxID=3020828 RepID=UPI00232FE732|nr:hypothetical protein [Phyllobacterium sp. IY22]